MDKSDTLIVKRQVSMREYSRAQKAAQQRVMSRDEREAQLVSYVWGNAPEGDTGTLKTVRKNLDLLVED